MAAELLEVDFRGGQSFTKVLLLENLNILGILNDNVLQLLEVVLDLLDLDDKRVHLSVLLVGKLQTFLGDLELELVYLALERSHLVLKHSKDVFVLEALKTLVDRAQVNFLVDDLWLRLLH